MKETFIKQIEDENDENLKIFAKMIEEGKTVIFPTETVYGLGANALDEEAASKIYKAKGRPSDNPLIVHIAEISQLKELVLEITDDMKKVMEKFWPGPLTIIFKKSEIVPLKTTGGLDTVAIRMPSHKIANKLLKLCKLPIAAPSANISGRPSPTKAKHVVDEMKNRVDAIIVSKDSDVGLESTVLDMTSEIATILRPGGVTKEDLLTVLPNVEIDKAIIQKDSNLIPKSPGMKYTHYSPKSQVILVCGEEERMIQKINELILENDDKKIAVLCKSKNKEKYKTNYILDMGDTIQEAAHLLFQKLIESESYGIDIIYAETFDEKGLGLAVMNRLKKSAGYVTIQA